MIQLVLVVSGPIPDTHTEIAASGAYSDRWSGGKPEEAPVPSREWTHRYDHGRRLDPRSKAPYLCQAEAAHLKFADRSERHRTKNYTLAGHEAS